MVFRSVLRGKRNLEKEHRRLADAVTGRDKETTCALITEHLRLTAKFSLKSGIGDVARGALPAQVSSGGGTTLR